jgi:hypothetical protein
VASVVLQGVVVYAWRGPTDLMLTFITVTIGAMLNAVVIGITQVDVDAATLKLGMERVLERSWAVLVINFIFYYVASFGFAMLSTNEILDRILSIPLLLIAASLVFAQTVAVTINDERWWLVIPQSFGTSSRVAWSGAVMWRAIALFLVQIVPAFGEGALSGILTKAHVEQPLFWASQPLEAIWTVPVYVLITLVFFDAIGYEPKRSCDE